MSFLEQQRLLTYRRQLAALKERLERYGAADDVPKVAAWQHRFRGEDDEEQEEEENEDDDDDDGDDDDDDDDDDDGARDDNPRSRR
jgi:hypothetical protein